MIGMWHPEGISWTDDKALFLDLGHGFKDIPSNNSSDDILGFLNFYFIIKYFCKMTEDEKVGWHHWLNGHESE